MDRLEIYGTYGDLPCRLVEDDPIRPHIDFYDRIGPNARVMVLRDAETLEPTAVVCVRYCGEIPGSELALRSDPGGTIAVLYTIWSYRPGSGSTLVSRVLDHLRASRRGITRVVTMSPKTDMARRFHTKNGAVLVQENHDTINYEYSLGG